MTGECLVPNHTPRAAASSAEAPSAESQQGFLNARSPSGSLLHFPGGSPCDGSLHAPAQRGRCALRGDPVTRAALSLFAILRTLQDVARSIWSFPADYRAQQLLMEVLQRQRQQHYEHKRTARNQEPLNFDWDEPIC